MRKRPEMQNFEILVTKMEKSVIRITVSQRKVKKIKSIEDLLWLLQKYRSNMGDHRGKQKA